VNPDLAAQPTLSTSTSRPVMPYMHADMGIKQRALDRTTPPSVPPGH